MTLNAGDQGPKLVYGMRGAIPTDRMEQIHLDLPYSMKLRDVLPYLADPLALPHAGIGLMKARVRLSYGWHMLNQARIALVEAEACTIFYEECQRNHTEALYRCQYYLDDAALRLHSSCEHMLQSVVTHWSLSLPAKTTSSDTSATTSNAVTCPEEARKSLLTHVLKAVKQSKDEQVRVDVGKILEQLRSSKEWKTCMKHRNDWVHNRLPAVTGLYPDINFGTFDYEKQLPPEIAKDLGLAGRQGISMSVGVGKSISIIREIVRTAYCELFRVYEELAKLLAECGETAAP